MHAIIRLAGEVGIKSSYVRTQFQRRLVANIHAAFKEFKAQPATLRIVEEWGLVHLYCEGAAIEAAALRLLPRIFGIKSFSLIEASCPSVMEDIVTTGTALFHSRILGKSFAVRAQRSGKHPFSSMDVQTQLGAALNHEGLARVDLSAPEQELHLQIRGTTTYFYIDRVAGPGGFPLGSGGRALCLLSGGFDSAVAAWLCQKRGVVMDYVFFNLAGAAYEHSVAKVAKHLSEHWSYGNQSSLYVVDFSPLAAHLRQKVEPRYLQIILKRCFYRAASRLALKKRAAALITGEALGQVSSQTLTNLATIDPAASVPVLRPLLTMEKEEIIAMSRVIGTFDLTKSTQEFCQLSTEKPATACSLRHAEEAEAGIDFDLLDQALAGTKKISLHELSLSTMLMDYIFTDTVAADAQVIDCRSEDEYRRWHWDGAAHHEYADLAENWRRLPLKATYLIYCAVGVQSAIIAEKMQSAGYLAYSFKGGSEKLRSYPRHQACELVYL